MTYDKLTVDLAAGDVLAFFSDGLVETRHGREEYGVERLRRGLETHATLPTSSLGDRLIEDLERFLAGEPPHDDVTLTVVRVL